MFRKLASASLATFIIGAATLGAASLAGTGSAAAFDGRWDRSQERPAYGWRPAPPAFHGYWGQRQWRRFGEDDRRFVRPRHYESYGYGWR